MDERWRQDILHGYTYVYQSFNQISPGGESIFHEFFLATGENDES